MSADEGLQIGRRIKARRIAAQISGLMPEGVSVESVEKITDQEWMDLDYLSRGGRLPKRAVSPETRALVMEYLAQWPRYEDSPDNNR